MAVQWVAAVALALIISSKTYAGPTSSTHPHVWLAFGYGGLLVSLPILLAVIRPGVFANRYVIGCAQMLMSGLLIHVTNGRIETHFHVFGSLAFIAFYRDWKLLIFATVVVGADHLWRGIYMPASVFGVASDPNLRWLEHVAWVAFEDVILLMQIKNTTAALRNSCIREADLEFSNEMIEHAVRLRTAELTANQALTSSVLESAQDGVVVSDWQGTILEFNEAACALTGYSREEAVGASFIDLIVPESLREEVRCDLRRFLETGDSESIGIRRETVGMRKDGSEFESEVSASMIVSSDPPAFTSFIRDITTRRQMESQLAHAQKMESIGHLAAGIAHEINTPNQYIGDNARFLRSSFASIFALLDQYERLESAVETDDAPAIRLDIECARKKADLDFMRTEIPNAIEESLVGVGRVSSIVSAMKDFSHPGVDEMTLSDLNRIVESTVTVARNEWKYVAELKLGLSPGLPQIPCLPGELGQVVLNLVVNAAHAIAEANGNSGDLGQILISTAEVEEWVELRVSDTGTGIPEGARHKVFNPFFTTKEVGKGTGQGLAITHAVIVERHGGQIFFETQAGVGTTFVVRLPIAPVAAAEDAAA